MGRSRLNETIVLYIGHGLAILLSVMLLASSFYALSGLQQISHKLYQHPFTVNNATLKLKINVLNIRIRMLQIASGADQSEQSKAAIAEAESLCAENLLQIKKYFLGDMSRVQRLESLLDQWHHDQVQVFNLRGNERQPMLGINVKKIGLEYDAEISNLIDYVESYSSQRAELFLKESDHMMSNELNVLTSIAVLVMLTLIATGYLTRRFILQLLQLKLAEAEVRVLNDELEQRVKERTAELESFSYSVSHDLRVPLRAIDGFSRILLEEYQAKLDDEGKRLLGVVRANTVRMAQLIDDILAFSRLGRKDMVAQDVDMEGLAKASAADIAPAWTGREVKLDIGKLPRAQGDAAMLRQVWVNLLGNAVKFTRPQSPALINVGSIRENNETVYYVKDNGVGFDMQYADKLFGVFQRLHGPAEFEGTGIGLAIVKRIITRHGGKVWAEGKIKEGATIYFTLPIGERKP